MELAVTPLEDTATSALERGGGGLVDSQFRFEKEKVQKKFLEEFFWGRLLM